MSVLELELELKLELELELKLRRKYKVQKDLYFTLNFVYILSQNKIYTLSYFLYNHIIKEKLL